MSAQGDIRADLHPANARWSLADTSQVTGSSQMQSRQLADVAHRELTAARPSLGSQPYC